MAQAGHAELSQEHCRSVRISNNHNQFIAQMQNIDYFQNSWIIDKFDAPPFSYATAGWRLFYFFIGNATAS